MYIVQTFEAFKDNNSICIITTHLSRSLIQIKQNIIKTWTEYKILPDNFQIVVFMHALQDLYIFGNIALRIEPACGRSKDSW